MRGLPEISTSRLTREECLTHLTAVLRSEDSAPLASRDVRLAWTAYLELVVEPAGWRAVLVPSPDTAELLNTEAGRRGSLVVEVVDVTCDSLEAEVEIISGALELEGKLATVPVDELYPVKEQEISSLNMTPTIVALDLIRFFYKVPYLSNCMTFRINLFLFRTSGCPGTRTVSAVTGCRSTSRTDSTSTSAWSVARGTRQPPSG